MTRRRLSEYRSKVIVSWALNLPYVGWSIDSSASIHERIKSVTSHGGYVVKVDQGIKARFKKGLVLLDVQQGDIEKKVTELQTDGYESFIIEPYVKHNDGMERYVSLMQDRQGIKLSYSAEGGINIESNARSVVSCMIDEATDWHELASQTKLSVERLKALVEVFTKNYFVFLEINPYIITGGEPMILDCAVEVDDAGMYFTCAWTEDDIRTAKGAKATAEEVVVRTLDANSPASFNLSVLNPDGAIFLLLSGGGASVVIADEVYNQGYGKELANYGEYSGNPNSHEAYIYTAEVMKLLLASGAKQKIMFIGGAVANFTDIANTFAGVIQAIDEYSAQLAKQKVKIYVRRGGPRQEIGLAKMHATLEKYNLLGGVYDPSTSITDALGAALKGLKK